MKLARISLIFGLLLIFQSCGSGQVEENTKKRAEIIAVHDEVMPKMGQLKSLEKSALQKVEELSAMDSVDSVQIEALKNLALDLDKAYEGMFVWMRQYETEDGDQTPEEIKAYLDEQLILVMEVNKNMKTALSKADSLLKIQ
ncbi:hypothetical protein D0X99_05145 [Algoriphagus lacus]|uniref:Viral A-type inclusion protein n=1 Tax=Algoriphagus lacus TaxID=2056311 RepID=A0A418PUB0_9BACT|nr:hypothetical protein [Algoriphagus lacus]RIW17140.1 hypothetical protein D0X99_05145 [Algoriphagus lacus]